MFFISTFRYVFPSPCTSTSGDLCGGDRETNQPKTKRVAGYPLTLTLALTLTLPLALT